MSQPRSNDSLFARLRSLIGGRPQPLALPAPSEPLPIGAEAGRSIAQPTALHGTFSAFALPPNFAETPAQALTNLLTLLGTFLDTSTTPTPTVTAVSVVERALGVGNRRGISSDPMGIVELKGGRLDAVVRFALGASDEAAVNNAIAALQGDLLAAKDTLFTQSVLKMTALESSAAAEFPEGSGTWRRTADYRVLYEYQFASTDDAHGLIARIEVGDVGPGEAMVITRADFVRWGDDTAADLVLRTGTQVTAIDIWAFLPATFNGAAVTITATVNGVVTQQNFATLRDFVNAFALATEPVVLGANAFSVGTMTFPNAAFPDPITLAGGANEFRIAYADAAFAESAIVYLRVHGG